MFPCVCVCVCVCVSTFAVPMFVSMHAQAKVNYSKVTLVEKIVSTGKDIYYNQGRKKIIQIHKKLN